ncbi:MAG: class I SAM-dependent methyltransferase [Smithellaceae bacterium]|nr:class I SAM-dependent methyltransferase [Smithellaceae bacterium]
MHTIDSLERYPFKGFLDRDEAIRLYELAREASKLGPCLEIGSYCGRSAAFLGVGCRETGGFLFSVDHHRGSEEQQPGQEYFDPDLVDKETGLIDTLQIFRRTISDLSLEDVVIPIIGRSLSLARFWTTPLALVFIDGGHTFEAAYNDYSSWSPHIIAGGYLLIHDVFSDPANGGQAPWCVYNLALASGLYEELPMVKTLGILRKANPGVMSSIADGCWSKFKY